MFDNTFNINSILSRKHHIFINFFKKIYGNQVKFNYRNYGPVLSKYNLEYCESETPLYDSYGYCIVWFLWFLELRLKNRNLTTKEIFEKIKSILNKNPEKICYILAGYAQFVDKLTKDYKYVIIDSKVDKISLKTGIKLAKRQRRIGGFVASLIILLSSLYMFRLRIRLRDLERRKSQQNTTILANEVKQY